MKKIDVTEAQNNLRKLIEDIAKNHEQIQNFSYPMQPKLI